MDEGGDLKQNISLIISTLIEMLCNNKSKVNYNYESLNEKIIKYKNIEKKKITDVLDNMTVEERQADNELRRNKIDKWNKGSGHKYSKERYEDENQEETRIQLEIDNEIEKDELSMSNIGEDNDNYGEEEEKEYGDTDDM